MAFLLFGVLFILLFLGVPIGISMGMSVLTALFLGGGTHSGNGSCPADVYSNR